MLGTAAVAGAVVSEIVADAGDVDIASLIPPADVFVTFSSSGYIKRVNQDEFRTQNRAGKGKTGAALKENDVVIRDGKKNYTKIIDYDKADAFELNLSSIDDNICVIDVDGDNEK